VRHRYKPPHKIRELREVTLYIGGSRLWDSRFWFSLHPLAGIIAASGKAYVCNSHQTCEHIHPFKDRLMQLNERWNNKLTFPLSELGERYQRRDFGIILDCSAHQGDFLEREQFSLAVFSEDAGGFGVPSWNRDSSGGVNDCQLPMLIESVHIVHDADRIVFSVAPSLVGLQIPDKGKGRGIDDPFYFSLKSANVVARQGFFLEDRKFDGVFMLKSILGTGEMPSDVIEGRSKMMDDFATQNTEPLRDNQVLKIVNRILPFLRIYIGEDWVFALFEEISNLVVQINDILIGPL
jgi:hypothetical protein